MTTLGFIGTGGMGVGMAGNLLKAGYNLVVNDIQRDRCEGLEKAGANYAETPKAVAEASEIVFSMLPNNQAAKSVATGPNGLLERRKVLGYGLISAPSTRRQSLMPIKNSQKKGGS